MPSHLKFNQSCKVVSTNGVQLRSTDFNLRLPKFHQTRIDNTHHYYTIKKKFNIIIKNLLYMCKSESLHAFNTHSIKITLTPLVLPRLLARGLARVSITHIIIKYFAINFSFLDIQLQGLLSNKLIRSSIDTLPNILHCCQGWDPSQLPCGCRFFQTSYTS